MATTALPAEVIRRVEQAGFKAVPTGIDHGTITVVIAGRPFEVTTLREDVETFGRKAIGRVRPRLEGRCRAARLHHQRAVGLAATERCTIMSAGLPISKARRVRFIGDAATRIAEDYLRILRFFRFHAAYGEGPPDAAGLQRRIAAREGLDEALARAGADGADEAARRRRARSPTLAVMAEAGILGPVLGGVPVLPGFAAMIAARRRARARARSGARARRARRAIVEDAERLWQRLRLSNAEHERLAAMGDGWWRVAPAMGAQAAHALLYRLGPARFTDRVLLAWARSGTAATDTAWRELATLPERWTAPRLSAQGGRLHRARARKGPASGRALRAAEQAWIDADFPRTGERAMRSPMSAR